MARKSVWKGTAGDKSLPVPAKNRIWTGKKLASLWSRQKMTKITKKAHAGRGPETKWEIPDKTIWEISVKCRIKNA